MSTTRVPHERVQDAGEARSHSRRALLSGVAAGALVATAGKLPLIQPAQAQDLSAQARRTYVNRRPITVAEQDEANPYPSTIDVRRMPGSVTNVEVALDGLTHAKVENLDIVLVSPRGRAVLLMSDVGGDERVDNLLLRISDSGDGPMPLAGGLDSGHYEPTNHDPVGDQDIFRSPGPQSFKSTMAEFNGLSGGQLNGAWRLYIVDDARHGGGTILNGWSLEITTTNSSPIANNDSYSVRRGRTLKVDRPGVLRNDRDRDGDRLRVVPLNEESRFGTIDLKRNGSFTFEANKNRKGTARFDYTVEDGKGGLSTAKIRIRVR